MNNMKKRTAAGTAMALVGGAFWGLSGVCGQYLFQTKEMTATWLVPVRLFVSGLLLLAFFLAKDAKRTLSVWKNKKTAIDLLIYSFAGIMLCQYAYFQTIEWSNAGTATVVQYIGPALIVVFVCITTHRKPLPKEIVAVVLALAGIFVIATHGNPGTLVLSRRALIMGLLSAFAVVVYTVQPVELLKQYGAPMILAWGMLIGGTVLMLAFQPWNHMPIVDAKMIEIVLYIIVFGTMAGFSMYMQSVKLIGGVKAGLYACIEPVAATILSVVWMKVQFAPMDLLGFVLILATIFVLAIPTKEERRGAGIRG